MDKYVAYNRPRFSVMLMTLILVAAQACTSQPITVNLLQGIRLSTNNVPQLDRQLTFVLEGVGTCQSVNVDWGDGTIERGVVPVSGQRIELDTSNVESRYLTHTFTGWGGGKTVTVEGVGCEGKVNLRFDAPPLQKTFGWNTVTPPSTVPGGTGAVCRTVSPGLPNLIPRMLVHISAENLAGQRGIDFGCFVGGCVYDADGKPGSVADSRFPFPGLREWSVVYMVGSPLGTNTQVEQGGTTTQFTTRVGGPLVFCLNDGDQDLTDNKGGFDVTISVDQLGP